MKNFFKLFGIIALIAVIGFSIAGCKNGDDDGSTVEETSGRLTISGLSEYNGKFVIAFEDKETDYLVAAAQIDGKALKGGKIANGSVTLKVWKTIEDSALNYDGNNAGVNFMVTIYKIETINENNAGDLSKVAGAGEVTVTFNKGKGSADITDITDITAIP